MVGSGVGTYFQGAGGIIESLRVLHYKIGLV